MSIKTKSILKRFLKAGLASAFTTMMLIVASYTKEGQIATLAETRTFVTALCVAFVNGFLTGVVMAGHKWASWKE